MEANYPKPVLMKAAEIIFLKEAAHYAKRSPVSLLQDGDGDGWARHEVAA